MLVVYNIGIYLYQFIIRLVSVFNPKARLWISGRKDWKHKLEEATNGATNLVWFHAASLGEFEQGRPLIEKIKAEQKDVFILLSFFSPSGYEIRKDYSGANYICYLPADTQKNARDFIKITQPKQTFFIKYEFWYNYMRELKKNKVPLFLISGIFRANHIFFKPYGVWFRKQLKAFSYFYVQNQESENHLKSIDLNNILVVGDTRFDRVIEIAEQTKEIENIKAFIDNKSCLVIGSSWPKDEEILSEYINKHPEYKYILAPHEIHESHLLGIEKSLNVSSQRYSTIQVDSLSKSSVLIIDNIGMLSILYKYADIAYVGGAFGTGLHNVLEAAVYGIPVLFGPDYSKFQEAKELIAFQASISVANYDELENNLELFFTDELERRKVGKKAKSFIYKSKGAVDLIYSDIFRKNS